jgi:hypothetical protein
MRQIRGLVVHISLKRIDAVVVKPEGTVELKKMVKVGFGAVRSSLCFDGCV